MTFIISDLRQRPEFFDAVADRIWQAWWKPYGVPLEDIIKRLTDNLAAERLPIALVAHRGDDFLGTASLIASDLDERLHYTPWVAAVWTEPKVRSHGVGRALVARACEAGFMLGFDKVYLCAGPPRRSYYVELGWTPIEEGVGPRDMTVFVRECPP